MLYVEQVKYDEKSIGKLKLLSDVVLSRDNYYNECVLTMSDASDVKFNVVDTNNNKKVALSFNEIHEILKAGVCITNIAIMFDDVNYLYIADMDNLSIRLKNCSVNNDNNHVMHAGYANYGGYFTNDRGDLVYDNEVLEGLSTSLSHLIVGLSSSGKSCIVVSYKLNFGCIKEFTLYKGTKAVKTIKNNGEYDNLFYKGFTTPDELQEMVAMLREDSINEVC